MSYINDTHTESSKIVHINSLDATTIFSSDKTTDFSYELEQPISIPENQLLLVSCIGATIPYTFYNIRNNVNNRIAVRLTENGLITNLDIPEGNYSSTALLLKVKELFDGAAFTETINITQWVTQTIYDWGPACRYYACRGQYAYNSISDNYCPVDPWRGP